MFWHCVFQAWLHARFSWNTFRKITMGVKCAMVFFKSSPGDSNIQPENDTHCSNG
jgi:hypothetical protein